MPGPHSFLDYFLITQLSAYLLIFTRIGAAVMLMPGFGEIYVPPRIRLMFALAFSLLLTPMLQPQMPPLPNSPLQLFIMLGGEILIGSFMSLLVRAMLSAVHVAGNIIATQSSLSVAALFDPNTGAQTAVVSNLLSIIAMTLFFALNLHHVLIAAMVKSYEVFPPGLIPAIGDMAKLETRTMADCFTLGVMLAGPHIAFSLIFYLAGGVLSRLMPTFQVFYVLPSLQILTALLLLMALLPMMMEHFTNFVDDRLQHFFIGEDNV